MYTRLGHNRVMPIPSRKRPLSNDDNYHRGMPSKKFNDADVRNILPDSSSSSTDSVSDVKYQGGLTVNVADITMSDVCNPIVGTSIPGALHHYKPELSFAENPFYYHANGILYDAHMHRLHRLSNEN